MRMTSFRFELSTRGGRGRGKNAWIQNKFSSDEMYDTLDEFYSTWPPDDPGKYYQAFLSEIEYMIDNGLFDVDNFGDISHLLD